MDCMELMAQFPDKHFELAITDPPYGLERMKHGSAKNNRTGYATGEWNNSKPTEQYFAELFRISNFQIIWGANNFTLPESEYFIVWDKAQTVDNFASAEYAWTNCKMPAKVFRYSVHQVMQDRKAEYGKIHPTQKPVALYKWLLTNYAKPGDKILDTHVGSASSLIACYDMGFDFIGSELDTDYFNAAQERITKHFSQVRLELPQETFTQESLI